MIRLSVVYYLLDLLLHLLTLLLLLHSTVLQLLRDHLVVDLPDMGLHFFYHHFSFFVLLISSLFLLLYHLHQVLVLVNVWQFYVRFFGVLSHSGLEMF